MEKDYELEFTLGAVKVSLDLYQRNLMTSAALRAVLIQLYEVLEDRESQRSLQAQLNKVKENGKTK
jgi:hypothetical protein